MPISINLWLEWMRTCADITLAVLGAALVCSPSSAVRFTGKLLQASLLPFFMCHCLHE